MPVIFDPTSVNFVMSTLQAANYLGVPPETVDDLVTRKLIPFSRLGERVVFSKAAIDAWLYAKSMENLTEDLRGLGFHGERPPA
ncbi:MAG TPA: helix-turn-helix domain-containing protein [Candidatus Limnocylindria bacterium]|nr:helix-turn-helix domain-containing protein [Candidatus Limnocylindria bacterium]